MVTALQLEEDTAASGANGASKGVAIPHHPWRKYPYSYLRCWWIFHAIDTPFIIFMVIWYIVVGIWGWIKTWIKTYQTSKPINWLAVWNMFYFYIYWECHHPNWRTHIFSEGLKSPTSKPVISWLVFWNMNFIFHFIYGIIPTPLMNSIIFQDGYCTTNQRRLEDSGTEVWKLHPHDRHYDPPCHCGDWMVR